MVFELHPVVSDHADQGPVLFQRYRPGDRSVVLQVSHGPFDQFDAVTFLYCFRLPDKVHHAIIRSNVEHGINVAQVEPAQEQSFCFQRGEG